MQGDDMAMRSGSSNKASNDIRLLSQPYQIHASPHESLWVYIVVVTPLPMSFRKAKTEGLVNALRFSMFVLSESA